jgi:hypothetical protein
MMEAVRTSETSVNFSVTTQLYIPETKLNTHHHLYPPQPHPCKVCALFSLYYNRENLLLIRANENEFLYWCFVSFISENLLPSQLYIKCFVLLISDVILLQFFYAISSSKSSNIIVLVLAQIMVSE